MLVHSVLPRQLTSPKVFALFCVACLAVAVLLINGSRRHPSNTGYNGKQNDTEIPLLLQIREHLEKVALHGKASVLSNIQRKWQALASEQTADGKLYGIYNADINDPGLFSSGICKAAESLEDSAVPMLFPRFAAFRIPLVRNRTYAVALYVRSAHTNRERDVRQGVRETWGKRAVELGMFVVFALGKPSKTNEVAVLRNETEQYGDLLIFNSFFDHYHNLSLKTHETMRYHEAHQPPDPVPSIYMWVNSDGFLFPRRVLNYIDGHKVHEHKNAIYGRCSCFGECRDANGPWVLRSGKWSYPEWVWPHNRFPHYCLGVAVMFGPGCTKGLVQAADKRSLKWMMDNWIDDATFAGFLRNDANLTLRGRFPVISYAEDRAPDTIAIHVQNGETSIATKDLYKTIWAQEKDKPPLFRPDLLARSDQFFMG